jgi:hypothetical protein
VAERIQGNTLPVGWGTQPHDGFTKWEDRIHEGSSLHAPTEPVAGGPVVEMPSARSYRWIRSTSPDGYNDPESRQRGGKYAGHLVQCWCGRTIGLGTPDMTMHGDTITCDYYRCHQIATMSLAKRTQRRILHEPKPGRRKRGLRFKRVAA